MEIEELLVAIGVDTSQASKIKDVVVALGAAAVAMADEANKINKNLDDIGASSVKSTDEARKKADEAGRSMSKLKMVAVGIGAAIGFVSGKVLGFLDSAIVGAKNLTKEKGLLFDISKQELQQADEYQEAMKKTGLSIESIKTKIALNLVPQLTAVANGFNEWMSANKELIANGLTKIISIGGKVVQVINNNVKAIGGWKSALIGLTALFVTLKWQMIAAFTTNPITWVVLAVVGLMLLIDDLMVYLDGGESLFGEFWGSCIEWINKVKKWWNELSDEWKGSLKLIGLILAATFGSNLFLTVTKGANLFNRAIGFLLSPIKMMTKLVMSAGKAVIWFGRALIMNPIGIVIGLVAGLVYVLYDLYKWLTKGESAFGDFWENCSKAWDNISSYFSELWDDIKSDAEAAWDALIDFIDITPQIMEAWEGIKGFFTGLWDDVGAIFDKAIGKLLGMIDKIKKPFEAVGGWLGDSADSVKKGAENVKSWMGSGTTDFSVRPVASSSSNSVSYGDTNVTQNIVTSDPVRAGKIAADGVNKNSDYARAVNNSSSVLTG